MNFTADVVLLFLSFVLKFASFFLKNADQSIAMTCFPFHYGEKKEEPISVNSASGRSNSSTNGEDDVKRSGSEFNSSKGPSDHSTESLRRTTVPSLSQRPSNLKVFTVPELKSATKSFSRSVMLGEGGFGCVYKGSIKSGDDPNKKIDVAVKQLGKRGVQVCIILCFRLCT